MLDILNINTADLLQFKHCHVLLQGEAPMDVARKVGSPFAMGKAGTFLL